MFWFSLWEPFAGPLPCSGSACWGPVYRSTTYVWFSLFSSLQVHHERFGSACWKPLQVHCCRSGSACWLLQVHYVCVGSACSALRRSTMYVWFSLLEAPCRSIAAALVQPVGFHRSITYVLVQPECLSLCAGPLLMLWFSLFSTSQVHYVRLVQPVGGPMQVHCCCSGSACWVPQVHYVCTGPA